MLKHFGPLVGRILLAAIFVIAGFNKITGFEGTAAYMASMGLPVPQLLLLATILIELCGGLMILLGWQARLAAAALFLFVIPATFIFHAFWNMDPADVMTLQNQMNHFLKNLAIMGGLLYVVVHGSGPLSVQKTH